MNKERLLTLAAFLDTVSESKFDIWSWRDGKLGDEDGDADDADDAESERDTDLLSMDCRTTGCAVGWACAMPEFKELGLRWDEERALPAFGNLNSWYAVHEFFGIGDEVAELLFQSHRYPPDPGPKDVAARIRATVEKTNE